MKTKHAYSRGHDARARESLLAFEDLHDLLGHDAYLRRLEAATQQLVVSTNFTKMKHSTPGGVNRSPSKNMILPMGL